jgi:hypothetical protein
MLAALNFAERLPFDSIQVPPVRLEGGSIYFRPQGPLHPATGQKDRLVFDFANLADASNEAFLEFASSWGVLGLCKHRKPLFHKVRPCLTRRAGGEYVESIASWRSRARHIRAILNVKASLKRHELGAGADWMTIWPAKPPEDRTDAAKFLGIVTSILLSQLNVHPALFYVDNRFTIQFLGGNLYDLLGAMNENEEISSWLSTSGNLLAEIAVGTALALQEGTGWTICSTPECRRLYRPKRHTPENRRHFCPDCGKRASWRMSKRRRKADKETKGQQLTD